MSEELRTPEHGGALVTVVVASYNHGRFVEQALRSVFDQTTPCEVIVTDDASTDDSQETILRVLQENGWLVRRIFHSENRGICATFNEALEQVGTPFVCFLAADDWMQNNRLERQLDSFLSAPEDGVLVHTDLYIVSESGIDTGDTWASCTPKANRVCGWAKADLRSVFPSGTVAAPSVMLRTQAVRDVGGYDEALEFEDLDMWERLARENSFCYIDEPLTYYRQVGSSLSREGSANGEMLRVSLRILERSIDSYPSLKDWIGWQRYGLAVEGARAGVLTVGEVRAASMPAIRVSRSPGVAWRVIHATVFGKARRAKRRLISPGGSGASRR